MNMHPYGFRIAGATTEARRLIAWASAFSAHAACDPRAKLDRECYFSAFTFGDDFRQRADGFGQLDVKGFAGECWSPFIWLDIDRDDLDRATTDARRLAVSIDERYKLANEVLLIFFSGSKGYHIGLPTWLSSPARRLRSTRSLDALPRRSPLQPVSRSTRAFTTRCERFGHRIAGTQKPVYTSEGYRSTS